MSISKLKKSNYSKKQKHYINLEEEFPYFYNFLL